MLYIAERRLTERSQANQKIKVYSNQKTVTLYLNGKKLGAATGDYGRFYFDVELKPGQNIIQARSGKKLMDEVELIYSR
jgi:beta-galactosidase